MVQILRVVTSLAFLATTTAHFDAYTVVSSEKCEPACELGQACTEHELVCFTAPCDPEHVCAFRATENQTNYCDPEVCPEGFICVPASLNDGSPIAACVPPCWAKNCDTNIDHMETCVMQGGDDGSNEATCVPLKSECHPVPKITCANVRCPSACKMIDCGHQCTPLV